MTMAYSTALIDTVMKFNISECHDSCLTHPYCQSWYFYQQTGSCSMYEKHLENKLLNDEIYGVVGPKNCSKNIIKH
jgi:hypothetical protein